MKNIILHGATNCNSSNYGDYIYGKMIYDYLKKQKVNCCFYQPSDFFKKNLTNYPKDNIDLKNATAIIYVPGGYFGEGHNAKLKENIVHFLRFLPIGIKASYKKIPIAVLAIGAGPNKCWFMNMGIKKICKHAKFITVRDKESYNALNKLTKNKANIIESFDYIILNNYITNKKYKQIEEIKKNKGNKKILLIHYNHSEIALEKFAISLNKFLVNNNEYYTVITADSILENEDELFAKFNNICNKANYHFIYDDPNELTELLNICDLVLTCKLHVGVVASLFHKSVVVSACHPEKTKRFYDAIGEVDRCTSLFEASVDDIVELLNKYHNKKIEIPKKLFEKANITKVELDKFLKDLNHENSK